MVRFLARYVAVASASDESALFIVSIAPGLSSSTSLDAAKTFASRSLLLASRCMVCLLLFDDLSRISGKLVLTLSCVYGADLYSIALRRYDICRT